MSDTIFYIILSIVGFFGTAALMVNAYFFKMFNDSLANVNIGLAQLITREESRDKQLDDHEHRLRSLEG